MGEASSQGGLLGRLRRLKPQTYLSSAAPQLVDTSSSEELLKSSTSDIGDCIKGKKEAKLYIKFKLLTRELAFKSLIPLSDDFIFCMFFFN